MRRSLVGKYNSSIIDFKELYSLEKLSSMNDLDLVCNFFGCNSETREFTLIDYLNSHFRTSNLNIEMQDIEFQIKCDNDYNYVKYDQRNNKYTEIDLNTAKNEAQSIIWKLRVFNNNINQIAEICNKYLFHDKKIFESVLFNKINNDFLNLSYGERVLFSIYFPKIFTCFKSIKDEKNFFSSSDLKYDDYYAFNNMIEIYKYCKTHSCNTIDLAYCFYNFPSEKRLLINLDFLKFNQEQVNKLLKYGNIKLNLEYSLEDTFFPYRVNLIPFNNYYNETLCLYFKQKIIAKFIIHKCIINKKIIELELKNLKQLSIKCEIQPNLPILFIESSKISIETLSDKYSSVMKIEQIINENSNLHIITRLHLYKYFNLDTLHKYNFVEKELYIIVDIDKKEIMKLIVLYNKEKDLYYIDRDEFYQMTRSYPRRRMMIELYDANDNVITFGDGESFLHFLGYNVRANNGLSDNDRKELLYHIVKNNYLSKFEIISHLQKEAQKRSNQDNMMDAVEKWESDIRYLSNLHFIVEKATHYYQVEKGQI